ncbi:MAG: hypothetical protein Q7K44_02890 [Candidatus Liptonbacteria bacterium]|nr:hypothetical protein [Candidatus Liptonbacteria bacterium]
MDEIQQLKKDVADIKERNARVDMDKAWETSATRKILVAVLTYAAVVLFFFFAELPKPFVNAIVPTVGFVLSTLSVPVFKKIWLRFRQQGGGGGK